MVRHRTRPEREKPLNADTHRIDHDVPRRQSRDSSGCFQPGMSVHYGRRRPKKTRCHVHFRYPLGWHERSVRCIFNVRACTGSCG